MVNFLKIHSNKKNDTFQNYLQQKQDNRNFQTNHFEKLSTFKRSENVPNVCFLKNNSKIEHDRSSFGNSINSTNDTEVIKNQLMKSPNRSNGEIQNQQLRTTSGSLQFPPTNSQYVKNDNFFKSFAKSDQKFNSEQFTNDQPVKISELLKPLPQFFIKHEIVKQNNYLSDKNEPFVSSAESHKKHVNSDQFNSQILKPKQSPFNNLYSNRPFFFPIFGSQYSSSKHKMTSKNPDENNVPIFDPFKWTINKFEIKPGYLGRGAFGEVLHAIEKKSRLEVAIKRMGKMEIIRKRSTRNVIREIEILSSLSHVNIIKLFGFFWDSEFLYLILELASDKDLFDKLLINPDGLEEKQVVFYLKQIIKALAYLNSRNLMHRDLKPENILLSDDVIKLADFGTATTFSDRKNQTLVGTVEYWSPEQIKREAYDWRIELWQLGVLTYELLSCKTPFREKTPEETNENIQLAKFEMLPEFSRHAQNFLKRLLVVNPDERMSFKDCLAHPFIVQFEFGSLNGEDLV